MIIFVIFLKIEQKYLKKCAQKFSIIFPNISQLFLKMFHVNIYKKHFSIFLQIFSNVLHMFHDYLSADISCFISWFVSNISQYFTVLFEKYRGLDFLLCFTMVHSVFSVCFKEIFHNIFQCLSYVDKSLPYCFVRELLRTANARLFLAALLPIPALADSSARSSLITAHRFFTSRMSRSRCSCFMLVWGAWSASDTE